MSETEKQTNDSADYGADSIKVLRGLDAVRAAMYGQEFPNLTGGTATMLPNHHLTKPVTTEDLLRLVRDERPHSANRPT